MKIIDTDKIPEPKGHYSMVVHHNGLLYLSGQLPVSSDGTIPDGIEAQTQLVLEKIDLLLTEAGSSRQQVLQMRVYVSDGDLWGKVNEVYAQFFGDHKPARAVVPTRDLHYSCLIEVEGIAFVESSVKH